MRHALGGEPCPPLVRGEWSSDEFTKDAPPHGRFGVAKSPAGQRVIRVNRKLNWTDVVDALTDLFMPHAARLNL